MASRNAAAKNLGLITLCGLVGYLMYRQSLNAQENAWATISPPVPAPPGTAGMGYMPRVNLSRSGGTNMLAGLPGVWVPEDSGWNKPNVGVNGLGNLGFGFSSISHAISNVAEVAKTVAISAVPIVGPMLAIKKVGSDVGLPASVQKVISAAATIAIPVVGAAMVTKQVVDSKGTSLITMPAPKGNGQPAAVPATVQSSDGSTTQQTIYQDALGNVITQAQYNAIISAMSANPPQPVLVQDGSSPPTYGGFDGVVWSQSQYTAWAAGNVPAQPAVMPAVQSGSVANSTPISYTSPAAVATVAPASTISPTSTSMASAVLYDSDGNQIYYDANGNPYSISPAGIRTTFDAQGNPISTTDANGNPVSAAPATTTSTGNIVMPDGSVYDSAGNLVSAAPGSTTALAVPTPATAATNPANLPANTPNGSALPWLLAAGGGVAAFFMFKK